MNKQKLSKIRWANSGSCFQFDCVIQSSIKYLCSDFLNNAFWDMKGVEKRLQQASTKANKSVVAIVWKKNHFLGWSMDFGMRPRPCKQNLIRFCKYLARLRSETLNPDWKVLQWTLKWSIKGVTLMCFYLHPRNRELPKNHTCWHCNELDFKGPTQLKKP